MTKSNLTQPTLAAEFKNEWQHFTKLFKKIKHDPTTKCVHDFRVSTRRLEAYLSLLKTYGKEVVSDGKLSVMKKMLKVFRSRLSDVRNFDADLELLEQQDLKSLPKLPSQVIDTLIQKRKKYSKKASRFFKDVSLKKQSQLAKEIMRTLSKKQSAKPIPVQNILKKSEDSVIKSFPQSLHKGRMKAKKLRYQAEILQKMGYSPQVKLDQLKQLQDTVGNLQDTIVLLATLQKGSLKKLQSKTTEFQKALQLRQKDLIVSSQAAFQGAPWVN